LSHQPPLPRPNPEAADGADQLLGRKAGQGAATSAGTRTTWRIAAGSSFGAVCHGSLMTKTMLPLATFCCILQPDRPESSISPTGLGKKDPEFHKNSGFFLLGNRTKTSKTCPSVAISWQLL